MEISVLLRFTIHLQSSAIYSIVLPVEEPRRADQHTDISRRHNGFGDPSQRIPRWSCCQDITPPRIHRSWDSAFEIEA